MGNQATTCTAPPAGWHCTRAAGHEGPCAALPTPPPAVEAGASDLPLLTEVLKLRGEVSSKEELLRVTEAKLTASRAALEDTRNFAAELQQQLAEARGQQVHPAVRLVTTMRYPGPPTPAQNPPTPQPREAAGEEGGERS